MKISKCFEAGRNKTRNYAPASREDSVVAYLEELALPALLPAAAVYPRRSVCLFVVLAGRLG